MSLPYNRHKDNVALWRAIRRCKNEGIAWNQTYPRDWAALENRARRLRDTPHPCSCSMCGNPRRSGWTRGRRKLTMQEIKANLTEKEQAEQNKH